MRGHALAARSVVLVGVLLAVALSAATTGRSAGSGRTRWVMTDLGECSPVAINDGGQITGTCSKGGKVTGFLWQKGKMTELGTLEADLQAEPSAINASGQIVGRCARYGPVGNTDGVVRSLAFLWERGRMIKLGTLGGKQTQAEAINDRGQIIGHSETKSGEWRAVLWEKGRITDLWESVPTSPSAINNHGQIVGTRWPTEQAFLWENGRTRDLGTLGGDTSSAPAINERGQVVGVSRTARGAPHAPLHAFLWEKGKMVDLGTLGGDSGSEARGINERGQIIGTGYNKAAEFHVFVWEKGRMTDLDISGATNTYLGAPPGGWSANAMNDRGQIIVNTDTWSKGSEKQHAFIWEKGRVTALGTLGGNATKAFAINNHDQIIGTSTTKTGQTHAVLWTLRSGA